MACNDHAALVDDDHAIEAKPLDARGDPLDLLFRMRARIVVAGLDLVERKMLDVLAR